MKISGAEIICKSLAEEGVSHVFGYPGGAVLPLYDKLYDFKKIKHILVRHEQCAAHAADGYARATGKVGVCFATSGPGATNLVTGLANAYLDSIPVVAMTGQVNVGLIGTDGFQEIDITGVTLPITKHNFLVDKVEDLAPIIKEAFYLARTGRPGPVLIDIPKDIQNQTCNFNYPSSVNLPGYKPQLEGNYLQLKRAISLIKKSQRPLILVGRGVRNAQASAELQKFIEKTDVPVIATLLGISSLPEEHPLFLGFAGMHGFKHANLAITESDLLIAIGMRFDDRITGDASKFALQAKKIHIDIDPAEIGKIVDIDVPIVGDAKVVLSQLLKVYDKDDKKENDKKKWIEKLQKERKGHPVACKFNLEIMEKVGEKGAINPAYVISQISQNIPTDALVVSDVGQHQMWVAQSYCFRHPDTLFNSGGLGTMGFGLPAALGVKVAYPDRSVWAIVGDGGIQMTFQELGTLVQDKIGVKIALMNNGYLGMVRQWQDMFYNKRYSSTPISGPDFMKLADAYGIKGIRVKESEGVLEAIKEAEKEEGPVLLEFVVEEEANVFPMVPAGAELKDTIVE